ncbi:MAG: amino acid adenylation domain-containing protein [Chloroflexi bacterium]|nr:amino acid adenylation domain-containing protein [Chloroflexota bacterium]
MDSNKRSERLRNLSPEKRARLLQSLQQAATARDATARIPHDPQPGPAPLSFAQERLWFLDQLEGGSAAYNDRVVLRLSGSLNQAALEQALTQVIARHEPLRTVFSVVEDRAAQVVLPAWRVELAPTDLRALPTADQDVEIRRIVTAEVQQSFDLARGPLLSFRLFQLADDLHVLLFVIHHIVNDGWSFGVFVREIAALYTALTAGQSANLPALPISYIDYTRWQRKRMAGPTGQEQLAYWKTQLSADLPPLDLPTDRPRPAVQSFRGGHCYRTLPPELAQALQALSRQEDATLFMTLLAAFNVLLWRYSGQSDLLVGSPIANRTQVETEPLIGCFVNTLVLRSDLSGNPSFRELLGRVRATTLAAYAHQDVPFEHVVAELHPQRDLGRNPLFQVMFILQNAPMDALELPGLRIELMLIESERAIFDLTLVTHDTAQGLELALEYNADLWDAATMERLLQQFGTLLAGIAEHPQQSLADLPLLTDAEQQQILVEWNASARDYLLDQPFTQLFEAQVARTPEAIAIVCEDQSINYDQLNRRANRWARQLVALGVESGVLVGLLMDRGIDFITAILAIFKAGGAFVPLVPRDPPARHALVLQQSNSPVVLLTSDFEPLLVESLQALPEAARPHALVVERVPELPSADENLPVRGQSRDLAYVMYTSGSTGLPKGAMVEQVGMLNHMYGKMHDTGMTAADALAQTGPQSFNIVVWQCIAPLLLGGRVVVLRDQVALDPRRLLLELERQAVTVVELVPAMIRAMLHEGEQLAAEQPRLARLRWMIPTGDALTAELVRFWFRHYPAIPLLNTYGSTECSDDQCHWPIHAAPPLDYPLPIMPIGRPIGNMQAYCLDARMRPVPVGVIGELYLGGIGVGRGYINDPDRTAGAFVPDPFAQGIPAEPGRRLYRTRDRGRYDTDGTLEFLGRRDMMIKIRGLRIEPGEIEAVLAKHPAVRSVVVVARPDAAGEPQLVAYVVENLEPRTKNLEDEGEAGSRFLVLGSADLRQHVGQSLPEYMIPAQFVFLPALPINANGKVDRNALPTPEFETQPTEVAAPRTPIQEALAAIWSQVLGVEQIGVHTSFFALGGHSLLAYQTIARVREAFGIELSVRAIFEAPTIATLAERITQAQGERSGLVLPPLTHTVHGNTAPPSFAQERFWLLAQLDPASPVYNVPFQVRLDGVLDPAALQHALDEIVRRHAVLRTTLQLVAGELLQVIAPDGSCPLALHDLSDLPATQQTTRAAALTDEFVRQPFDLGRGPLLRVALLRLSPTQHLLLLNAHHAVFDGWSLGVFTREILAAYHGQTQPELPVQYADYSAWQRQWLQSDGSGTALEAQLDYWRQQLAGAPPLILPIDHQPADLSTGGAAIESFVLGHDLTQGLHELCRAAGVTPFMALLAGFQTLLHRYSEQTDLSIGIDTANRSAIQTEDLIGCFINLLVIRADLGGDPSVRELLGRVRAVTLAAYAHQDVPFELVVKALQPDRSQRTPLFQTLFSLQNMPGAELEVPGLSATETPLGTGVAKYDLILMLGPDGDQLQGVFEYNTALFEAATIRRLVAQFQRLLAAMIATPDAPISRLPLLTTADLQTILIDLNTPRTFALDQPVHQLIEAQALAHPDAVVARHGSQSISYAELNARANQLAHWLRLHVPPQAAVGVLGERGLDLLRVLLATLKSGHTYIPLTPDYPDARLESIIADSGIALLIAESSLLDRAQRVAQAAAQPPQICCWNAAPVGSGIAGAAEYAHQPQHNLDIAIHPQQVANVFYTSGSTGRPKGVMVEQIGMLNHLSAKIELLELDRNSRVAQTASQGFDISIWQFLAPLMVGGQVVIYDTETVLDARALLPAMQRDNITILETVPTLLSAMLAELAAGHVSATLPDLRYLISNAETLPVALSRDWLLRFPHVPLLNTYGATECSDDTTHVVLCAPLAEDALRVPVGTPIPGFAIYVLDRYLAPVPIGAVGQIAMAGVGVGQGYLGAPEQTARVFVPNPFTQGVAFAPGSRLYLTGDQGRWNADGQLEFIDRLDRQVKVRGYRIELAEIEAVLSQYPQLRDVAVVIQEPPTGLQIVAFVVPKENLEPRTQNLEDSTDPGSKFLVLGSADLRQYASARLPHYMVPSAFVPLASLPINTNGKVDRRALATLRIGVETHSDAEFIGPRTPIEQQLARIWSEVLHVDAIGVHDNFFALGGDSLLVIEVVRRAGEARLHLTSRVLLQNQTIAELAPLIGSIPEVPAEQGLVTGPLPFTPNQAISFLTHDPDRHIWNISELFEVEPGLDATLLEQAAQALVVHHDGLRVCSVQEPTGWRQFIAPPSVASPFTYLDLSSVPEAERRAAIEAAAAQLQGSFNLQTGPLLRVALMDLGPGAAARLMVLTHHTVSDRYSSEVLWEDLNIAYDQLRQGQAVQLPPKSSSLLAFSERLNVYAQSGALDQELPYWLAEPRTRVRPLPVDHAGGRHTGADARSLPVALSGEDTALLQSRYGGVEHVQIIDVLLTALLQSLTPWTGTDELLIDLEHHGRDTIFEDIDLSRTVGWLNYRTPVLLSLAHPDDPAATLQSISAQRRAVPNRGLGHGLLRYLRGEEQIMGRLAALRDPEILFNFQGIYLHKDRANVFGARPAAEFKGLSYSMVTHRQHQLLIDGQIVGGQLHLVWTYGESVYRRETVEALVQAFMAALHDLIHIEESAGFQAPQTPVEESLAQIWADVLGLPVVSTRSDFYALGGTGALAEQIVQQAQSLFAVELSVEQLLAVPTVEAAALAIEFAVLDQIEEVDEE